LYSIVLQCIALCLSFLPAWRINDVTNIRDRTLHNPPAKKPTKAVFLRDS